MANAQRLGLGFAAVLLMSLGSCGGGDGGGADGAGGTAGGETATSGAAGQSTDPDGSGGQPDAAGAAGTGSSVGGRDVAPAAGGSGTRGDTGGSSGDGDSGGAAPAGGSAGNADTTPGSGGSASRAGENGRGGVGAAGSGGSGAQTDTGGGGAAGSAGSAGGLANRWMGLWDGVSVNTSDASADPVPFMALVDSQDRVFVADANRSVRGWGTINASGKIVFTVDGVLAGDVGALVEYSGLLEGDAGEGQWSRPPDAAGTWTITRRTGVAVDTACAAHCDSLAPCMGSPDDEPERSLGYCAFICALPSPAEVVMMDRLVGCDGTANCEALYDCYVAGTVDTAYVSPAGDDANDGAAPTRPKLTLNAAIAELAVDGTIRIAAGTFAENVVVTKPLTLVGGYDASFDTLDPAANPVVLNGGGTDRVVTIMTPPAGSNRLVLRGLSLVNGYTPSSGGAVAAAGITEVALEDCLLTDNVAEENGGGVAANDVVLTVSRCHFESNLANGNAGGGLDANRSLVTLLDSSFTDNQVANYGGGINLYESESTIAGCEITGNSAGVSGGGINFSNAAVGDHSLGSSVVTGNSPDDLSGLFEDAGGNTIGGS